jgi:hypothetical protein
VTEIGEYCFEGTPWLKNMQKDNKMVIINDILIDGRACKGQITIPDTVRVIATNAFSINNNVTDVIIPSSVTHIMEGAFGDCENLVSITIPASVTSIDEDNFYACPKLTKVYGTIGSYAYQYFSNFPRIEFIDQ